MIFAELFDDMSFDERKNCLSMLGDYSIDNYTEEPNPYYSKGDKDICSVFIDGFSRQL